MALTNTSSTADILAYLIGTGNTEIAAPADGAWPGVDATFLSQSNGDQIWILICGFLVFWMHAGFSMLETGSVRHKNAVNILFKNVATVAIGGVFYFLWGFAFAYGTANLGKGSYRFIGSGNFVLAGLVSITAGCSTVPDWAALIIGIIGCFVYLGWSKFMLKMHIDDPVDAVAVHGACGVWGCLAVGIFSEQSLIKIAYSSECDFLGNSTGLQFASQLVGVLSIIAWVTLIMCPFFFALKACNFLRVPAEYEETGLDISEHGGQAAFTSDPVKPTPTKLVEETPPPAAATEEATDVPTAEVATN